MYRVRKSGLFALCLVATFFFFNPLSAKGKIFRERAGPSATCYWATGLDYSEIWVFEVSIQTLKELSVEKLALSATMKNILTILKQKKLESAGFLIDVDKLNRAKKQDCRLYGIKEQGVINYDIVIMSQYTWDCVHGAGQLGLRIAEKIDQENNVTFPLTDFPNFLGYEPTKTNKFGLSFVIANTAAMRAFLPSSRNPDAEFWQAKFTTYPVTAYQVKPGDTLWSIALRKTDDALNWPALWALNSDRIPTARFLVPGKQIFYPSPIQSWKIIKHKGVQASFLASEVYGTAKLGRLVEWVTKTTASSSDPSYSLLPEFSNIDAVREIYIGKKWFKGSPAFQ